MKMGQQAKGQKDLEEFGTLHSKTEKRETRNSVVGRAVHPAVVEGGI